MDLGVERHVRYLGQMDAVEDVLGCADLFVLTSQNESFGLAALEAMSSGVPVIGTTAGGLPELIAPARPTTCSPVGDVEGMARRAIEVLSDRQEARRDGGRVAPARGGAVRGSRVVPLYENFYAETLDLPPRMPAHLAPPEGLA